MQLHIIHADGLKRAVTNVQGNSCYANFSSLDGLQQPGGEMQAGRGRRDRASLVSINGLIPLAVFDGICRPLDIWWQRCAAESIDYAIQRFFSFKPDQAQTVVARFNHLAVKIRITEHDASAGREAARRASQAFPKGRFNFAQQQ